LTIEEVAFYDAVKKCFVGMFFVELLPIIVCLYGQVGLRHSARYRYWWPDDARFISGGGWFAKVRTNSVHALRLILGQALTSLTVSSLICDRWWQSDLVTPGCHLRQGYCLSPAYPQARLYFTLWAGPVLLDSPGYLGVPAGWLAWVQCC